MEYQEVSSIKKFFLGKTKGVIKGEKNYMKEL